MLERLKHVGVTTHPFHIAVHDVAVVVPRKVEHTTFITELQSFPITVTDNNQNTP
jgi:hypothetical protein